MTSAPVVTRAELVALGHDRGAGDRRVRAGDLVRAAPSTYMEVESDLRARVQAALLHAGGDAVVTGWAACVALDLPYVPRGGPVDVLVPAARKRISTRHVHLIRTARPPLTWTRAQDGVLLADPPRAVVDAARGLTRLVDVRALVLGAIGTRRVTREELEQELEAGARGGRRLVRRALADARAGAASAPEAELFDVVAAAAGRGVLPPFLLNPELRVHGELVGSPDGWFLGHGLGWEVDSREFHDDDDLFDETLARHDHFAAHGLTLLHVTPRRLRRLGQGYLPVLADAVRARERVPEPTGLAVLPVGPVQPVRRRPAARQ